MTLLRIFFIVFLSFLFFLQGCQEYEEDFEIIRNPFFRVTTGGESWSTSEVTLVSLGKITEFNPETDKRTIYERLVIYSSTSKDGFKKLQLTIDVNNVRDLVFNYTFEYANNGGFKEIIYFTETDATEYISYFSCSEQKEENLLTITKHSSEDNLISGFFNAVLCETDNPENLITITGEFKDIEYEEVK